MSTISVRWDSDAREAVLLYDGEPVAPDSRVTMPASAIAELAFGGMKEGFTAGIAEAQAQDPRERVRRILKTVARDEAGRITAIVEEGPL